MKKLGLILASCLTLVGCTHDHDVHVSLRNGQVFFTLPDSPSVSAIFVDAVSEHSHIVWKVLATGSNGPDVRELGYGQVPRGMSASVNPEKLMVGQLYRVTILTADGGGEQDFVIADPTDGPVDVTVLR
jgi:hypothetical protein